MPKYGRAVQQNIRDGIRKRTRIAELDKLGCYSQHQIAYILGMSLSAVNKHIAIIDKERKARSVDDRQDKVDREKSCIDEIQRIAFDSFKRSQDRGVKITKEESDKLGIKKVVTLVKQTGDNAYLSTILACVRLRSDLDGLSAPIKHDHTLKDERSFEAETTDDLVLAIRTRVASMMAERAAAKLNGDGHGSNGQSNGSANGFNGNGKSN